MRGAEVAERFKKRFIFFGRNSGIHGLHYLFDANRSLLVRMFWLLTLIASVCCLCLLLEHDKGDEVNFTIDTLYLNWTTTFPGVTLCEQHSTKIALRKFTALYPDLLNLLNYDHRRYLTDLLFARGECSNAQCAPCGQTVACDVPWRTIIERLFSDKHSCHYPHVISAVESSHQYEQYKPKHEVHKTCQEMVADCSYNGVEFPCCEYFRLVDSEHGPCFSFNTLQHKGDNSLFVVNMTTGPAVLMFRLLSNAEISIHSPEELSTNNLDGKLKQIVHTYSENQVGFLFSVVEMENDDQLRMKDVNERQCRYLHEVPEVPFHTYPVYSYGACRLAYSTKEFYQQCGCIHPVRDLTYEKFYCNYSGMNCWNTYDAHKIKVGEDINAGDDCLPSCVESELKILHYTKRWIHDAPYEGALVEVKMGSLPSLRYQRNLMRDDLDTVVAVGGIFGLFFSASILSLLELFYLILRPYY